MVKFTHQRQVGEPDYEILFSGERGAIVLKIIIIKYFTLLRG